MSIEYFDVVDENDRLTGEKTTKKLAHKDAIPHRVAAVFIFDKDKKLLVQKHRFHGRLLDHSVGGHVSAGETYRQAALREMEEELAIRNIDLHEIATSFGSDEHYQSGDHLIHFFGLFEADVPDNWEFTETHEVDQLLHMEIGQVVELMNVHPEQFLIGFINTMKKYIEVKKLPYEIQDHD